jgi:2-iminoacetate synthase
MNYASPQTAEVGNALIQKTIAEMTGIAKQRAEKLVKRVEAGKDDVYC